MIATKFVEAAWASIGNPNQFESGNDMDLNIDTAPLDDSTNAVLRKLRANGFDKAGVSYVVEPSVVSQAEYACAGWLSKVGHRHPSVRLAVATGRLDPAALTPHDDWPPLHDAYQQVLEKPRASCVRGRRK